ncbi:hypothetical protein [Desulfosporosinus sp. Sb-LF]|uniref:hypothetical protein n=1 Tax=Desulfosporosinus sp. Sb-LF TaxID=2560027 RepID=UPI00107F6C31|nr:hypothetical protein [Desulfosporosinus sp. Sb-LF]TGE33502.1 hypothetical protein E4K68_04965 [Desulfosporosinus sp. Sb-LF]
MNIEEFLELEPDELYILLQKMPPQELDELQSIVLERIKELREEIALARKTFSSLKIEPEK